MTARTIPFRSLPLAHQIGFFSALFNTAGGVIYFLAIVWAIASGRFTFPPEEGLQLFGGISSLIICPVMVVMLAALHAVTPAPKKVLSQVSLGFTLLFALAVTINRFSQLGVVRQAAAAGKTEGISWFLAYGDYSVFLGFEYLGWAWFLGLALLFAAPLFSGRGLEGWLRWLMVLYGVLGLVSAVGFLVGSWLSLLGFVAWGVVLYVITGLLVMFFRRLPYPAETPHSPLGPHAYPDPR